MSSSNSHIILGIDPGTIITGYALISVERELKAVDFGCIRPPKTRQLSQRYCVIFQSILLLLDRHQPREIAIETPFLRNNVQSTLKLGGAMASVMIAAQEKKIPIYGYAPREVKYGILGYGGASKEEIASVVSSLLHLGRQSLYNDVTDALAIAIYHSQVRGRGGEEL